MIMKMKSDNMYTNLSFLKEFKVNKVDILEFCYCPHRDEDRCNCKKTKKGMINYILQKYRNIDLKKSSNLGDFTVDIQLAEKFDLKMLHITKYPLNNSRNYFALNKIGDILARNLI